MKIFNSFGQEEKINFVDENNVFVGFDMIQRCCEDFGYFITDKIYKKIIKNLPVPSIENFNFDTTFFEKHTFRIHESEDKSEEIVIFKLIDKNNKELYLHLYNYHNGYYMHGFSVSKKERIREGAI